MLEIADVTKNKPHLFDLLARAYQEIYLPAFPDPDERTTLEGIVDAVLETVPGVRITVNIIGNSLLDPNHRVLKAIGIAYYYERENVGLLAYNAVAPDFRGQGLGKMLVQSRVESLKSLAKQNGKMLGGVFIECNDPVKVAPNEDSFDPALRIQIFKKWGAREIPVPYVQPPLGEGRPHCDRLKLLNYPVDGRYAGPREVMAFVTGIYRECRGHDPAILENDSYYQSTMAGISQWMPAKFTLLAAGQDVGSSALPVSWL